MLGPDAVMEPDLVLPGPVPQRAAGSGLLNERALLQMVDSLYRRVRASLSAARFPFVYGADCSVLLAAVPAVRDIAGRAGLLFVDGHEDATPMDLSLSGEAANMEIALLLGLTGERAPQPLRDRLPALAPGAIAMLGPRDHLFRAGGSGGHAVRAVIVSRVGAGYLAPAGAVSVQDQGLVHALPSAAPGSATADIGKTGSMPAALPADLHAVCYTAPRTAPRSSRNLKPRAAYYQSASSAFGFLRRTGEMRSGL